METCSLINSFVKPANFLVKERLSCSRGFVLVIGLGLLEVRWDVDLVEKGGGGAGAAIEARVRGRSRDGFIDGR